VNDIIKLEFPSTGCSRSFRFATNRACELVSDYGTCEQGENVWAREQVLVMNMMSSLFSPISYWKTQAFDIH